MIKNEFINQFAHTWRAFKLLVNDFEADAWLFTGRTLITPARLSLHILLGTQYYLEDLSEMHFASRKPFNPE